MPATGLLRTVWTSCNELLYGIRTTAAGGFSHARDADSYAGTATADAQFGDNNRYETPDYFNLRWIRNRLWREPTARDDVIYDLGCGMGRVLCVMASRPFKKVVGVELFEDLAAAARTNARTMRGRRAPVEVLTGDASRVSLDEGTVFFLFNSFGPETLAAVLASLRESLARQPRPVQLVYYNAMHDDVVADSGCLELAAEERTRNGLRVTYWRRPI